MTTTKATTAKQAAERDRLTPEERDVARAYVLAQTAAVKAAGQLRAALDVLSTAVDGVERLDRKRLLAADVGLPETEDYRNIWSHLNGLTWQADHTRELLLGVCPSAAVLALVGDWRELRPLGRSGVGTPEHAAALSRSVWRREVVETLTRLGIDAPVYPEPAAGGDNTDAA